MLAYTARRLGSAALLVWIVLSGAFVLLHLAPGEPGVLYEDPRITPEIRQELRQLYGWDRPIHEQYLSWLGAAARGDWGVSFSRRQPAMGLLLAHVPATALLVLTGVFLEHLLGILVGVWVARRPGGWLDRQVQWISLVLYSVPAFVLGLFAIDVLAVRLGLFPPQHMTSAHWERLPPAQKVRDLLHHRALPALVIGVRRFGAVVRFLRGGLIEALSQDYVLTARAKGLRESRVLFVHALPNTLGPLIQRLGSSLPQLFAGTVILEVVFSWPGIGRLIYVSVLQRDYPVVLAGTALVAVLVVLCNLAADLFHAWLDPRVRDGLA
ncbi:MAG: ABC transporter permease [Holophagales bacterium]|nr:ABC transporter permease [Holophagales bacterium]